MKKALVIAALVFFAAGGAYALLSDDADNISIGSPPNPAVGRIIHASEENIVIRADSGKEYTFVNRQDIPVDHLEEHKEDKDPVSIQWRTEGNSRLATRVDDAL